MNRTRNKLAALAAAAAVGLASLASPAPADAAGLLIADGGFGGRLEIVSHDADVTVNNGIAVTEVEQIFRNTENRIVEALYVFPVPEGASVADFSMWIGGKEMTGEVLEKQRAREIYESYKQTRRDPGLLEQVDYRTFEMRIFPIPAGAEQRVKVTYYQELDVDHDTATYVYPLATNVVDGAADTAVQGRFSLDFDARTAVPITGLSSPSHPDGFSVSRPSETTASASLELAGGTLSEDVVLHLTAERPVTGIDVVANKPDGEDGFFQLTLTAGEELEQKAGGGMDYVFVLDVSGSMADDRKLELSADAASSFIGALAEGDRFEVLTFNNTLNALFGDLAGADDAALQRAATFVDSQRAVGGTRLRPAFEAAYRYGVDPDRPLNVVVLSDGLSGGNTSFELQELIRQRPANARVFCVGVGNDVNRPLLEDVARNAGGLAAFVSPQDDLTRAAEAFRRKLVRPVATALKLSVGGGAYDFAPGEVPDLFHGAPIRVYGRYKRGGPTEVTLSGNVMGRDVTKTVTLDFPEAGGGNPEVERMWAWRRIDELQKHADRKGDRSAAVESEIVRLGEAFSIVSEYTSFIVLENDAEYERWNIERHNALRIGRDRAAQAAVRREFERLSDRAAMKVGPSPLAAQDAAAQPAEQVETAAPRQWADGDLDLDRADPRPSRRPTFGGGGGGGGGGAFGPIGGGLLLIGGAAAACLARRGRP